LTDHPLRRTSDSLEVMVGRIDERTAGIMDHLEKIHGRLGRVEARLDVVERQRDRQDGERQERSRWVGAMTLVGQKVIPAGGGIAGLVALWHAFVAQK
jgi:hypothetical protein